MEVNQIICGDNLEVMHRWDDNSVDLVFCSPPYEDARFYNMDFKIKGEDWVDWCLPRFIDCVRISRGLVAWVVEGRTRNFGYSMTPILLMAALHRAGIKMRKPPAFYRVGIPGSGGPDWLRNDYEFIVCSSKGKLPWSDNTAMGHPPKWAPGGEMSHRLGDGSRVNQWGSHANNTSGPRKADGSRGSNSGKPSHIIRTKRRCERGNEKGTPAGQPVIANPGNVIKCNVGGGTMGSELCHENEAPFPESLVEFFVRSFCPLGGVVVDPFCGSGTVPAIAIKTERNYLGIDCRQSQVDLTNKRIAEVRSEFALFGEK